MGDYLHFIDGEAETLVIQLTRGHRARMNGRAIQVPNLISTTIPGEIKTKRQVKCEHMQINNYPINTKPPSFYSRYEK